MSYHYWSKDPLDWTLARLFGDDPGGWPESIFSDSGAYSAMSQGLVIDPHAYADWLARWNEHIDVYASLDVIGDPDVSQRNLTILEDAGLTPLPVYHTGEPWGWLEDYCREYPYVAIGGMAGTVPMGFKTLAKHLARAHRIAAAHDTALHGFGITGWRAVVDFPWRSVDSSSWTTGQRYGIGMVWTGRKMDKFEQRAPRTLIRLAGPVRRLGFDPKRFVGDGYHYRWMSGLTGVSWLAMERMLQRSRPDFRLYLADVTPWTFNYLAQAVRSIAETGEAEIELRTEKGIRDGMA